MFLFFCGADDIIVGDFVQTGEDSDMDAMTKMWVSLIGIGLMALAAVAITVARLKTRGIIRFVLSLIAFILLFAGFLLGLISII